MGSVKWKVKKMARDNAAYDISRYENVVPEKKAEAAPKISVKRRNVQEGSTPKLFVSAVALCLLLCCVLYGNVETDSLYSQIADEKVRIDVLASENVRMKSEIEAKTSLKNIENFAENVLGLQKLDNSQKEYIEISNDNSVVIPENTENVFVKIKNKFFDIVEYLKG